MANQEAQRKMRQGSVEIVYNFLDKGDYDSAIAFLDKLIEKDPNNPDYYFQRGTAYRRKASSLKYGTQRNTDYDDIFDKSNEDFFKALEFYEQQAS